VACLLVALVCITLGAFTAWEQHSGVPARMSVTECQPAGKDVRCVGVWRHDGSAVEEKMRIEGAEPGDVGHEIDVHVHGRSYATSDSLTGPAFLLGGACVLGVLVVILIVRRRRRPNVSTVRPSQGSTEFPPPQ
jgi:hypothetical protein